MAPAKKRGNRGQKNNRIKNEKLSSFIKDFDSQVKTIVEELKASVANSLKEVDTLYNIELIKLPAAIREMRWLDYFAKGGRLKALEAAATVNVDIEQITSSVSQTPFKPSKKALLRVSDPAQIPLSFCWHFLSQSVCMLVHASIYIPCVSPRLPAENPNCACTRPKMWLPENFRTGARWEDAAKKAKCNSFENDEENIPVQSVLRPRTNAKASTAKKLATTRKTRVSAANTTAKRTSKRSRATPSNSKLADSSVLGYTPMITPKIDTRVFKTPALRTPSVREPVYTFSANGSPLGGMDELFINLPSGDGKNIRLTAGDMEMVNLSRLDKKAFDNIKLLSNRLEKLCKTLK